MTASEGVQDEVAVHGYLKAWLLSHILVSDMQYRNFLEDKRKGDATLTYDSQKDS
jgi:hemerythrin